MTLRYEDGPGFSGWAQSYRKNSFKWKREAEEEVGEESEDAV